MKPSERNKELMNMVTEYAMLHDRYTMNIILTDKEWQSYIDGMDRIGSKYSGTHMERFSNTIRQGYLDDTEYIQNKIKAARQTK